MRDFFLSSALAFSVAAVTPACAQQIGGVRIGASAGYDHAQRDDLYYSLPDDLAGLRLGGTIGYDLAVTSRLAIGAHAGIGWVVGATSSADLTRDRIISKPGSDLELMGRASYALRPGTIVSAGLGVARSTVTTRYRYAVSGGFETETFQQRRSGVRMGVGLEQKLAGPIFGTLDYRYTNYGESKRYDVYDDRHQLLVGFALRL
jgi:outer membrane immunogenic protein